jgi:hypothetical protein
VRNCKTRLHLVHLQVQAALYISVSMAARDSFAKDAAADVCAAVCASLLVSPAITIVDRSIMQNASGVMKVISMLTDCCLVSSAH